MDNNPYLRPWVLVVARWIHRLARALRRYPARLIHPNFPQRMDRDNNKWRTFLEVLNFQWNQWGCNGDFTNTTEILEDMWISDIDGSLRNFEWLGAHCDCQILALLAPQAEPQQESTHE